MCLASLSGTVAAVMTGLHAKKSPVTHVATPNLQCGVVPIEADGAVVFLQHELRQRAVELPVHAQPSGVVAAADHGGGRGRLVVRDRRLRWVLPELRDRSDHRGREHDDAAGREQQGGQLLAHLGRCGCGRARAPADGLRSKLWLKPSRRCWRPGSRPSRARPGPARALPSSRAASSASQGSQLAAVPE